MQEFVFVYRLPREHEDSGADNAAWNGCPALASGGAVEVGTLVELPDGQGAESA